MISVSDLSDEQKESIRHWAEEGVTLGEIQKRFGEQFEVTMTYLDARMLIADLGIALKEERPEEKPEGDAAADPGGEGAENLAAGKVKITVSDVAPPGMVASGKVRFSDGEEAAWYFDEMGRLGLDPEKEEYRPSEADLSAFREELQRVAQGSGI